MEIMPILITILPLLHVRINHKGDLNNVDSIKMRSEDIQKPEQPFIDMNALLILTVINDLYGEKAMRNVFRNALMALMTEKT
jgi:hypothetical protein